MPGRAPFRHLRGLTRHGASLPVCSSATTDGPPTRQGPYRRRLTSQTGHLQSAQPTDPTSRPGGTAGAPSVVGQDRWGGPRNPGSGPSPLPMTRPHLSAGTVYVISWTPPGAPTLQSPRPRPRPLATARPPKPSLSWEGSKAQVTISATATGTTFQPPGGGKVTGYNQCHTQEPRHLSTFQHLKCSFKARINKIPGVVKEDVCRRTRVLTRAAPRHPIQTGSRE